MLRLLCQLSLMLNLCVIMLNVIMLSVVMLNVIMHRASWRPFTLRLEFHAQHSKGNILCQLIFLVQLSLKKYLAGTNALAYFYLL
jgi:hypothetical protein